MYRFYGTALTERCGREACPFNCLSKHPVIPHLRHFLTKYLTPDVCGKANIVSRRDEEKVPNVQTSGENYCERSVSPL